MGEFLPALEHPFDTGGGTQHITQSLGTVGVWAAPGVFPPNFRGGIGVTKDGVEGVDITIPVYNFAETHYIDAALVTGAYKAALFYLTGTVNNGPFRGFAAGEVLFLGAAGSIRGQEDWEIAYRFAASPNVQGLTVGSMTGIAKRGWELPLDSVRGRRRTARRCAGVPSPVKSNRRTPGTPATTQGRDPQTAAR
uniref:Uncharacterized protein n=1 Tax=Schlesneria paludicola TaxID=360056 RepID=A0A7C2JZN0_9PLAN